MKRGFRRHFPLLSLCVLLLAAVFLVILSPPAQASMQLSLQSILDHSFSVNLENYIAERVPLRAQQKQVIFALDLFGGRREQDGVIVGSTTLLKAPGALNPGVVNSNTGAILEFSAYCRSIDLPVYMTLIPTSSEILREELPSFYSSVSQRSFIDGIYNRASGQLSSIDTYAPLLAARRDYIYYRTENNLTSSGGFIVFQALANRMLNISGLSRNQFDLLYADQSFYGNLYKLAPAPGIAPDILALPYYSRYSRTYTITHYQSSGNRIYHTLYPQHLLHLGQSSDVYLGGLSAVTDIQTSAPYSRKLLLFADSTAQSYLPYLVNYYGQITVVDLFHNTAQYTAISPQQYDQVLIAYSTETYMNNSYLSQIQGFIPADQL